MLVRLRIILSYLYRDGGTAARHEIWPSTFQQTLLSLVRMLANGTLFSNGSYGVPVPESPQRVPRKQHASAARAVRVLVWRR
jgi:hypothetical protein